MLLHKEKRIQCFKTLFVTLLNTTAQSVKWLPGWLDDGEFRTEFPAGKKKVGRHSKVSIPSLIFGAVPWLKAVSRRPLTAEVRVRSRLSPCGICGGQSGTWTGFSPITSVFPCQFHSNGAPLHGKLRKKLIFIIGLHNKPQGCGASVASAAGPFTTKKKSNIQCLPAVIFLVAKRPGRESDRPPTSV
jgi:hypothetical protein